jgi:hypothetical protein
VAYVKNSAILFSTHRQHCCRIAPSACSADGIAEKGDLAKAEGQAARVCVSLPGFTLSGFMRQSWKPSNLIACSIFALEKWCGGCSPDLIEPSAFQGPCF